MNVLCVFARVPACTIFALSCLKECRFVIFIQNLRYVENSDELKQVQYDVENCGTLLAEEMLVLKSLSC